ncbi:MAG: preprotein translocase subunit SecG [Pseudobdellovibrio sp.]
MITFVATIHILACIALVGLVLVQDSKGDGVFTGQTTSNSVLGATGATTLAGTLTKVVGLILVVTCITLAILTSKSQKSVIDSSVIPSATAPANGAAPVETAPTENTTPATETPAAAPADAPTK